jgi:hypothetical protein
MLTIGIDVASPSSTQVAEGTNISARVSMAFEITRDVAAAAPLRAAAWARMRGKLFVAAVCVNDTPPRLGCGRLENIPRSPVSTVPIRSQTEEDEAALLAARRLEGFWQGDGHVLHVDGQRAQANIDPDAPFEWRRFLIKRVSSDAVVFSLGTELFEARRSGATVTLTGTSFRGERTLTRD